MWLRKCSICNTCPHCRLVAALLDYDKYYITCITSTTTITITITTITTIITITITTTTTMITVTSTIIAITIAATSATIATIPITTVTTITIPMLLVLIATIGRDHCSEVLFGQARLWKVLRAIGLMAAGKCCDRRQALGFGFRGFALGGLGPRG